MHVLGWKVGPLRVYNTQLWVKNMEDEEYACRNVHFQEELESEDKRDSPLAYSSKYWEITLVKFFPTDLSSLFKPQQWLSSKK
jgi:hypothetical protein